MINSGAINVILEIELVYPYKLSLTTLLEFNRLWGCKIISGGTKNMIAVISMPVKKFKKIFKENPKIKKYKTPVNAEGFIASVNVKELLIT